MKSYLIFSALIYSIVVVTFIISLLIFYHFSFSIGSVFLFIAPILSALFLTNRALKSISCMSKNEKLQKNILGLIIFLFDSLLLYMIISVYLSLLMLD